MKLSVKFLAFLVLLVLNGTLLKAQKHFIYIQSEDKQPFAVVLNGKVFSSSDYGYVIIPKLDEGKYDFTVSFPMNKFPDQFFTCTMNDKDLGFTLKSGNGGWALENLQSQKLIANNSSNNETVKNENAFGNMLSDVVDDSTLTQKKLPVADTIAKASEIKMVDMEQPQKIEETNLDTGTSMLFVDKGINGNDTVKIFIPSETVAIATTPQVEQSEVDDNNDTNAAVKLEQPVEESAVANNNDQANDTTTHEVSNPFYQPAQENATKTIDAANEVVNNSTPAIKSAAIREDCNNMISDDDLNKLKRKMFAKGSDKEMIDYAVKRLEDKCLTTDQVKGIGQLFSSDDGRYSLFEALYPYTYDYGKYPSLAGQIVDPYYKKRFMALLR
ncbi:MAG: DUF4476 domain-containing protein [Bacteroidetes bacterium]|nr:DUF4476 domain-containing protein [Bacteroidota bacterium]